MTMENQPFQDVSVSPIKDGDCPASHVNFIGCICFISPTPWIHEDIFKST